MFDFVGVVLSFRRAWDSLDFLYLVVGIRRFYGNGRINCKLAPP